MNLKKIEVKQNLLIKNGSKILQYTNQRKRNFYSARSPTGKFLFLRSDPENWPLGPNGFWESFAVVDGRLVTGQNPASSTAAAQSLLKLLVRKAA